MSVRTQRLWLLVKKNYTVKVKQGWLSLLSALLFPVLLMGIVAVMRPVASPEVYEQCNVQGYANPSSGTIPWLQTIICGASPACRADNLPTTEYGTASTNINYNGVNFTIPCAGQNFDKSFINSKFFGDRDVNFGAFELPTLASSLRDDANIASSASAFTTLTNGFASNQNLIQAFASNDVQGINNFFRSEKDQICNTTGEYIKNNFNQFWDVIFPIWKGKIVYYPGDNAAATKLVDKIASRFFKPVNDLNGYLDDFINFADIFSNLANDALEDDNALPLVSVLSLCSLDFSERFLPANSQDEINDLSHQLQENQEFYAILNFDNLAASDNSGTLPAHIQYIIQQTVQQTPATYEVQPKNYQPGTNKGNGRNRYIKGGFAYLQDMVDHVIAEEVSILNSATYFNLGSMLQMMPYPCYRTDDYMNALVGLIPFLMTVSFIYPVTSLTKDLVKDKDSKIRDALILCGASIDLQRFSWLLMPGLLYYISGFVLSILLWAAIYMHSSWFVIFLWVECFIFSMIGFITFMAAINSKPTRASAIAGLAFYGTSLVYGPSQAWGDKMALWVRFLLYLFPCTAMSQVAEMLGRMEILGNGITIDGPFTMSFSKNDRFYPRFYQLLIMLIVDGLIGFVLGWYIENLYPGETSRAQPWYFLFTKDYWFGEQDVNDGNHDHNSNSKPDKLQISYDHETEDNNKPAGVTLQNISRIYKSNSLLKKCFPKLAGEDVVAVNNVSVEFYKGQITAYLGRNGAGKTSTLQILAGMAKASKGNAWIDNINVTKNPEEAYALIGNCPQYNILIDELSPVDHIKFYAKLRDPSLTSKEGKKILSEQTTELIAAVGLSSDRCNTPSAFLSGGMKRKLSVALCFIGNPRVVFLDEPTAGVDPEARRGIWKLLQNQASKKQITMIMCTHHLDEAELLGDRVVVIDGGQIKCAGSNIWMKNQYGTGYVMTLTKSKGVDSKQFDEQKFFEILGGDETGCKIRPNYNSAEIEIEVPYAVFNNQKFIESLKTLDANLQEVGLDNYGLRDTTLEEIFLQLASNPNKDYENPAFDRSGVGIDNVEQEQINLSGRSRGNNKVHDQNEISDEFKKVGQLQGLSLIFQQFRGIIVKRAHVSTRDWKSAVSQILLPIAFVLLALSFTLITPDLSEWPKLELTPWLYDGKNSQIQSFSSLEDKNLAEFNDFDQALNSNPGWSTLCIPNYTPSTWDYGVQQYCASNQEATAYFNNPSAAFIEQTGKNRFKGTPITSNYNTTDCQCPTIIVSKDSKVFEYCPNGVGTTFLKAADTPYQIFQADMTDFKIAEDYLTGTYSDFFDQRVGALSIGVKNPFVDTSNGAKDFSWLNSTYLNPNNVRIWFSTGVFHSVPAYLNVFSNAHLRSFSTDPINAGISVFSNPVGATDEDAATNQAIAQLISDTIIALSVIFALSFLPASFIVILVDENEVGAKHLQLVAGLQQFQFWLANWLWDFFLYTIAAVLCFLIFVAFQEESFVSTQGPNWLAFLLLLLTFGWAIIPLEYPFYRLFKNSGNAYVAMLGINNFLGVGFCAMIFILDYLAQTDENIENIYNVLAWVCLPIPHFAFAQGMITMGQNWATYSFTKSFNPSAELASPLNFDLVGKNIMFMVLEGVVFFILLVGWESFMEKTSVSGKIDKNKNFNEDEDVAEERRKVDAGQKNQILLVDSLNKTFERPVVEEKQKLDSSVCCKKCWNPCGCCPCFKKDTKTMTAVDQLSFEVQPGECFGLLGVNGAGKTTTFKMITGEISPNFGKVHINGISMFDNPIKARSILGYCPQSDALNVLLTSEEHLVLYARIRGTPEKYVSNQVKNSLDRFGLAGKWASRQAGQLSGGGKRRLNAAVAFAGEPKLVLLDEPTAGLDPAARSKVWERVQRMARDGTSLVLTSHSVSECEQVCNRLAIMVNGRFKCMGSPQHIINRFGKGFIVTVRLNDQQIRRKSEITSQNHQNANQNSVTNLTTYIKNNFSDAKIIEEQQNILKYRIGETSPVKISEVLQVLQSVKNENLARDYSVTQATLDDVFIQFAREKDEEEKCREKAQKAIEEVEAITV